MTTGRINQVTMFKRRLSYGLSVGYNY